MIVANALEVCRGSFRLGPINLKLPEGSYLTLLGPSGAGKTILLETLMGLHPASAGSVTIDGLKTTDLPPEKRQISYLPQDLSLFPHLSVRDNILFGVRARGISPAKCEQRLKELSELLDLQGTLQRKEIASLSGGEKQRVALARALITEPRLLFLDEPHAALDASITRHLQVKLRRINRELRVTIVHVTHDQEEAFMLGEQIAILIDGKIPQLGSRDDIYYRPANRRVARFLRHQNIFDMTVSRHLETNRLQLQGDLPLVCISDLALPVGAKVSVGIRNEEVTLVRPDRPVGSDLAENLFKGTIVDIYGFGGFHTLVVKIQERPVHIELDLPNCAFRDLGLAIGDETNISLRARRLWVLPNDAG